jgi:ankyrin repeat protein
MVPLHYACSTNAPHFLDYIMALIDANHTESFTFKDNLGRTPLQLLTFKASSPDEKKRLPLHYLAATPNGLSEQSMKILVDAYPESLSSADKYDLLPFHYACLNQDSSLEVLMLFIYLSAELCIPKPCKSI